MATRGDKTKEEVINILVIKDPTNWRDDTGENVTNDSLVTQDKSGQLLFDNDGDKFVSTAGKQYHQTQTFVVDDIHGQSPAVGFKSDPLSLLNNFFPSTSISSTCASRMDADEIDATNKNKFYNGRAQSHNSNRTDLSSSMSTISSHSFHCSSSMDGSEVSKAATTSSSHNTPVIYSSCLHIAITSHPTTQLYTSVLHRSPSKMSNLSPQVSQSVQHCSPIPSLQNKVTMDSDTPSVETPPDSGFCTPSESNRATANQFLTSTPRGCKSSNVQSQKASGISVTKLCGTAYTKEALNQRFAELYQAMECDSLDESLSEDAKEDESETSHNSSLRSVQWLKEYPIADSITPLLSSSPAHRVTATATSASNTSSQIPLSCLKPLPVIMAPTIPSYLQPSSILSASNSHNAANCSDKGSDGKKGDAESSCSSSSITVTNSTSANDNNQDDEHTRRFNRQRKALEELKMNKAERNIGRSKYTGKIFSRPGYSYMDLIKMAMQTSDEGEMTLKEIVTWIEDHFPFFKHEAKDSWKSSIRHNLSLHSDFMKAGDKKHGCKWKLCDGLPQPNLQVPSLPEMTSAQTAFIKKAKRNAPQPILPKVNTYALVPIHGLVDQSTQPAQTAPLPPPPPLLRKPIHILPKPNSPSNNFVQETPVQQHQIMHQLLQEPTSHSAYTLAPSCSNLGIDESSMDTSSQTTFSSSTPFVYQSSDDNSNHAFNNLQHFLFDQQQQQHQQDFEVGSDASNVNVSHPELEQYQYAGTNKDQMIEIQQPLEGDNDFLNSVVEIRQEEGNNPGEKKIIFVLKEGDINKQRKSDCFSSETVIDTSNNYPTLIDKGNRAGASNVVNMTVPPLTKDKLRSSKSKGGNNGGRKKSKDRSGNRRRGPVLNLQSVLESKNEDRTASDTLGWLMGQDDEIGSNTKESKSFETDGFTQVKYRGANSDHLTCHMHRALSEHSGGLFKQNIDPLDFNHRQLSVDDETDFIPVKGKSNYRLFHPSNGNKLNIKDRMAIIKNRTFPDTYDWLPNKFNDTEESDFRGYDTQESSFSSCNTPSASQLVFRRLSSSDQTYNTYSSDSLSSNTPQSDTSRNNSCYDVSENGGSHKMVKTRPRSRRKQVHVPLTTENSPKGKFEGNNFLSYKKRATPDDESMEFADTDVTIAYEAHADRKPTFLCLQSSPSHFKPIVNDNKPFNLPSVHDKDIENIFTVGTPVKNSPHSSHFLSISKSPELLTLPSSSSSPSNSSNSNYISWLNNRISPTINHDTINTTCSLSPSSYGIFPYSNDEIPSFPSMWTSNKQNNMDKASCDIHLPKSSQTVRLPNHSTSMDTPPCGISLHSPISSTKSHSSNLISQSPFKIFTHSLPHAQHESLYSPNSDLSSMPSLQLDFSSAFLNLPTAPSSSATPVPTQQTSPSSNLTTPPNNFLQTSSPTDSVQQDSIPFQDNLYHLLDSSMTEHLDMFLNNLDASSFPGLHLSPNSTFPNSHLV